MRLSTRPFPNLQDADIIPYYWGPSIWLRWKRIWGKPNQPIYGLDGRLGPVGFALNFTRCGTFHNGSKLGIIFRYRREIEEMLV